MIKESLLFSDQLKDDQMLAKLRAEKFDFAFTEYFDVCGMAVFEKIGVRNYGALIASTLSGLFTSAYGIPATLSFVPGEFFGNLLERLENFNRL
jgi:hypothetical protein